MSTEKHMQISEEKNLHSSSEKCSLKLESYRDLYFVKV